jgi:hypothetical protein
VSSLIILIENPRAIRRLLFLLQTDPGLTIKVIAFVGAIEIFLNITL